MENDSKKAPLEKPTVEMVTDWVQRDLKAAHYFLGLLLRYPDVVAQAAKSIHEHAMMLEGSAAIDHIQKKAEMVEALKAEQNGVS